MQIIMTHTLGGGLMCLFTEWKCENEQSFEKGVNCKKIQSTTFAPVPFTQIKKVYKFYVFIVMLK